ncbi:hypothetical protein [Actinomadura sp. NEAU-AAG7]|uniref:hypothetical protein n=1 Tax=Actinomadura sp. NEAU-AAG7 TaxID=2839640 RepID=UPI001BE3CFB5|nr:hypothetical protein [Actinomadura sp. NEAU-AAG7]MBT2207687.1 hypothetical protein [Actinomadura sp. NEAU-AAG7]
MPVEQKAGWDDILVRDNFQDQGQTPTPDPMWRSPDLIPFGSDILDFDLLESSYNGPDLGVRHPIVYGGLNRVYVRGKSLRSGCPASGHVRLYYAAGGLFLDPRAWHPIYAENGDLTVPFVARGGSRQIAPGQICVSANAFVLPNRLPPGHYCMIGTVDTPAHPMPPRLPVFNSNVDYVNWVKNNPDVCWRNIDVIPCEQRRYVLTSLTIGNLNDTPTKYVFGVSGTHLPDGTAVFSSTDQRFPFVLPPVQIYAPGEDEVYSRSITLPPHYSGTVTVVVEFSQPLPCDATLMLRAYNPVTSSPGTLEHRLAVPLTGAQEAAEPGRFILLGEYTFVASRSAS